MEDDKGFTVNPWTVGMRNYIDVVDKVKPLWYQTVESYSISIQISEKQTKTSKPKDINILSLSLFSF